MIWISESQNAYAVRGYQVEVAPPRGTIKVTVRDAWITLEGEVEWQYLKSAAENFLHNLLGVKGVSNLIAVKSRFKATDITSDIRDAFKRSALLDANKIRVETTGNKVTLHGKVGTIPS